MSHADHQAASRLRVAIAYSAQRQTPDTDLRETVAELGQAIERLGHVPVPVPLGLDAAGFLHDLADLRADVVWNLCEEASGRPGRELHASALVELADRPVTGNPASTLALCLDKSRCRHVLAGHGVPVPAAETVREGQPVPEVLPLPAIVKPACQDGSVGVDREAVGHDAAQVQRAVQRLHAAGLGPALVEHFVQGREINVLLLGPPGGPVAHVALGEIDFGDLPPGEPALLTFAAKWDPEAPIFQRTPSRYPAVVDPGLEARLRHIGHAAWEALSLSGYARLDVRVDGQGRPFVIDVNPNPDIASGAGLQRALPTLGLTFQDFVDLQLRWAWIR